MGNAGAAVLDLVTHLAAYLQQRALRALATPRRARVPGNAPPEDNRGAAPNRSTRIQSEKMKPRSVLIPHIIQPRPLQMLSTDRVEERRYPILHDHQIIRTGYRGKSQAVLESLAASTRHRQPNPTGIRVGLCQGLLHLLYRYVSQGQYGFRCLAVVSGWLLVFHVVS